MSENQEFFQQINEAFFKGDVDFIFENITEHITWNMIGEQTLKGKAEVIEMMEPMRGMAAQSYHVNKLITHGNTAAIEGTMTVQNETGELANYAFCDIYKLDKFKNGKIKEITAFVIEI